MSRSAMVRLSLLAVLVVAAVPATAGTEGTTYYQCTVDISGAWHDCTEGVITLTTNSGIYRVARLDLASASYKRLDAFIDICNPSGWWSHVADSPTCNGFGGDAFTTDHDAEAYVLGTNFEMFSTYNYSRTAYDLIHRSQAVTAATGCYRVQWSVYEDRVFFDNDGDPADSARMEVRSVHGFESAPYNEADGEDPSGSDADRWYVGLNRTVYSSSRNGTGVDQACFVLSTTTSPSASVLSALCP
ncbi:MAG: hypothetical protein V3T72_00110 [Thermoanaerobaculia bacterium]